MSSLFQPHNNPGIGMVTTMPELLQPISWLLHACHGLYNQMCDYNNLKSNGRFNKVMVVSAKKHGGYHANFNVYFNQAGFCMGKQSHSYITSIQLPHLEAT